MDEHESPDDILARHARRARRNAWLGALAFITLLAAILYALLGEALGRAWRHAQLERAIHARQVSMTPLERVHADLLPAWILSTSNRLHDAPQRLERLRQALADDHGLSALLDAWSEALSDPERVVERAEELLEIVRMWNARMEATRSPWWVDANVRYGPQHSFFYIKTYKLLADFPVPIEAGGTHRTRIVARADTTNVVESFLGHTSPTQDGAIILADTLNTFATRDLWPLLHDPLPEDAPATMRAFAPRVRRELHAGLHADARATLERHAAHRYALEHTRRAILARRACGSSFAIMTLPWSGFPRDEEPMLRRYAERDRYATCPAITQEELDVLAGASALLREDAALKRSVEQLTAMAARAVVIHEVRHAADHAQHEAFVEPLPCVPCDERRMSLMARAELSAYLASFAAPETAAIALFQACGLDLERGGPHAAALRAGLPALGASCDVPPPDDLSERARRLEREWFGRSHTVTLPRDYPTHLELYRFEPDP